MSSSLPRENPLDKALNKLVDASQVIERRMGVKAAEGKRIDEAFKLLARGVTNGRGVKQQEPYLDFLRRVRTLVGDTGVALCAAGLGPSAVANMKDRDRVDLPFALKKREDVLRSEHLRRITQFHQRNSHLTYR